MVDLTQDQQRLKYMAYDAFKDIFKAESWLCQENGRLGGLTPLEAVEANHIQDDLLDGIMLICAGMDDSLFDRESHAERVARFEKLQRLFNKVSRCEAREWLTTQKVHPGGLTAVEALKTREGAHELQRRFAAIAFGV